MGNHLRGREDDGIFRLGRDEIGGENEEKVTGPTGGLTR